MKSLFLTLLLALPLPAAAQEAVPPVNVIAQADLSAQIRSAISIAQGELRDRAGREIFVKGDRARRFIESRANEHDLAALNAEAQARGMPVDALAVQQDLRVKGYLAGLAQLDGARVRAIETLRASGDQAGVLAQVNAQIASALSLLPVDQ